MTKARCAASSMCTSTKRTSASSKISKLRSRAATKSPSSRPSPEAKMATKKTSLDQQQSSRFWLMYPPKLIQQPLLWQLAKKFDVVTNVRQASITDEIGLVCLELHGKRAEIKNSVKWLEKQGVKVEPVEINVIES